MEIKSRLLKIKMQILYNPEEIFESYVIKIKIIVEYQNFKPVDIVCSSRIGFGSVIIHNLLIIHIQILIYK